MWVVRSGANGDRFPEKTVSSQNVAPRNSLILNGSILFLTVYGGGEAQRFPSDALKNTRFVSLCTQTQRNKGLRA
jgi:hypothetical protein